MRVNVLYFSILRERAGTRQESLDLPERATVADLKTALAGRRPALAPHLDHVVIAVNRDFAQPEQPLADGDEVGIFPPVSGGAASPTILRLTEETLDLNSLLSSLVTPTTGAACVFSGVVRGRTERSDPHDTDYLEYEAYPPMAEEKLRQVAEEMRARWPAVEGIAIVHRLGRLEAGTPTILVACTAAHRDTGVFEAARYGIDRLKEIVPVWKKEVGPDGERWVEGGYHPAEGDRSS
jgi:molybdopterin synthase catalytic subunit